MHRFINMVHEISKSAVEEIDKFLTHTFNVIRRPRQMDVFKCRKYCVMSTRCIDNSDRRLSTLRIELGESHLPGLTFPVLTQTSMTSPTSI